MNKVKTCPICNRTHFQDQPCPRRLARACISATPENLKALTHADREAYGQLFPAGNVSTWEDMVEEAISDRLEQST